MEYVYGRRPVLEALQAGRRKLSKLWIQEGAGGPAIEQIVQAAREKRIALQWVSTLALDRLVGRGHHQGVAAEAEAVPLHGLHEFLESLTPEGRHLLVAFDEIQDPQNIGAILRSAGFFGISGAIVPRWRTAPVGDTAARVSSGAIDRVPMISVTNLAESVRVLQEHHFEVIGADMEGEPLTGVSVTQRTALIFGSEGKGLRRLVRERCDRLVSITGRGRVQSLNVAAAAAVFLYHFTAK